MVSRVRIPDGRVEQLLDLKSSDLRQTGYYGHWVGYDRSGAPLILAYPKQRTLDHHNELLIYFRGTGDHSKEIDTLETIGAVYRSLGQWQAALDYYNRALVTSRSAGDRTKESRALAAIGGAYDSWGEKQKAFDYYTQALAIDRALHDAPAEAATLANLGELSDSLGEKERALDYYSQSLATVRAATNLTDLKGERGEANALNGRGLVYLSLGAFVVGNLRPALFRACPFGRRDFPDLCRRRPKIGVCATRPGHGEGREWDILQRPVSHNHQPFAGRL